MRCVALVGKAFAEIFRARGARRARAPERAPPLDATRPNAPGTYSLECGVIGSPPPKGAPFTCSARDEVVASGTEVTIASKAFSKGGGPIRSGAQCSVELITPGEYSIRTMRTSTP